MRTTQLIRIALPTWNRVLYVLISGVAVFFIARALFAQDGGDPELKVLKTGLGSGTITATGINCGTDCDQAFPSPDTVMLTATNDPGSTFAGWSGDCSGLGACSVTMSGNHAVRAAFTLDAAIPPLTESEADPITPERIAAYLDANRNVNTPARFLKALPAKYKQNWILMSRSESLQTGIALSPRLLLPSVNAKNVFTVGMTEHSSYPGSHRNAIEYMQWDAAQKNFRFHEIILDDIPPMIPVEGVMPPAFRIPARPRSILVSIDDAKCSKCHSTRNVLNLDRSGPVPVRGSTPGTDGVAPVRLKAKNKPNWDAYDSWGGMLPLNRDRIYQGSVEAASFRHIFNLWNWRNSAVNDGVRQIIEQLELQPSHVTATSPHRITRDPNNINDEGHINFGFDTLPAIPTTSASVGYSFDQSSVPAASVTREGRYVTLRHSDPIPPPSNDDYSNPVSDEGRGVQLFDLLGGLDGTLNPQRIADELIDHRFATGSVPIDVRPIALAITKRCLAINAGTVTSNPVSPTPLPPLTVALGFFNTRNGMGITDLVTDTQTRAESLPRRKVDIQRFNLFRTGDGYLATVNAAENGLMQQYGGVTPPGVDALVNRLRQEVFRRPLDLGRGDRTAMGGVYVDRELYGSVLDPAASDYTNLNTQKVALYRYFLEPLGVSVDKWSMGVRGRSRTYTFADVFGSYENTFTRELQASLGCNPAVPASMTACECGALIPAVNSSLSSLPAPGAVPTYTDVQRIFNKSCIECHGGLGYPPYSNYGGSFLDSLDLSEDEAPPPGDRRLTRSHRNATARASSLMGSLYRKITDYGRLTHPYDPVAIAIDERCPNFTGLMPCGGPPLSLTDIKTIERWIGGANPNTEGDPHLTTVDGVNYDFQSAGEFVLLRGEDLEIQARQTPVETESPLGTNAHTGLNSCVSVNSAVAVRFGGQRITYQPNLSGEPDPRGLQLRVDGQLTTLSAQGIPLQSGGRIIQTTAPGGIQIEAPGGTVVVVTPDFWDYGQVWFMNINTRRARATEGLIGAIAPGNWLPALPDGSWLGSRPVDAHQRYQDLYEKFADAWRVSDSNTLFDYAPGASTRTFTIDSWPLETPKACTLPRQQEGPPPKPPLKTLALEAAQQHCKGIVVEARRANCVQDVMVTGEPLFAKTYLMTEQIERNAAPTVPALGSPEDNKADLALPVTFTWNQATDADGDVVIYRHCVWLEGEQPNHNKCVATANATGSGRRRVVCALLVLLAGGLLIAILLLMGLRRRRGLLWLVVIATLVAAIIAFYLCGTRSKTASQTVSGLQPGKAYLWKVLAEDGKGNTVESETQRFTTK